MYTMSKLRKQALIRIVICVIMLAATIVFSFLLITGKLDGTSSSASSNADSLPSVSDSVEADTPESTEPVESTEPEPTPEPTPEPAPEPTPANFDGLAEQPTTVFAEGEQPSYTTTADASMNLRAGPGTNFDKVTSVPAGTAVTALGTNSDGSWVVVQVGGQYGWLKVEFLNQ